MTTTVLVIDSNSAVQAITTLALNQTDCRVETLSDATQAYQKIKSLKPNVVLCAKEIRGIDPYALCQKVKAESSETVFILLAPSEGVKQTAKEAKDAHYDDVIYKPFKSNRLREVVFGLLKESNTATLNDAVFVLKIEDGLRRSILERFLARTKAKVLPTLPDGTGANTIIITDEPSYVPPKFAGKVFGLGVGVEKGKKIDIPLTDASLIAALAGLVQPIEKTETEASALTFVAPDAAQLAADLSARIFRRLLISAGFKEGNWEETTQIIEEELNSIRQGKA